MSEVRTRKMEALELLALKWLDKDQEHRLNELTAQQAREQANNFVWKHMNFLWSIDACMALRIPEDAFWKIRTPVMIRAELYGADGLALAKEFGRTVPVAMLTCWWAIQTETA